jgi:hypothetical protein
MVSGRAGGGPARSAVAPAQGRVAGQVFEDALTDGIPGSRKRCGDTRVEALHGQRIGLPGDADGGARVDTPAFGRAGGTVGCVSDAKARSERGIGSGARRPDAVLPRRLERVHRRHEAGAGQPEGRGERCAIVEQRGDGDRAREPVLAP